MFLLHPESSKKECSSVKKLTTKSIARCLQKLKNQAAIISCTNFLLDVCFFVFHFVCEECTHKREYVVALTYAYIFFMIRKG